MNRLGRFLSAPLQDRVGPHVDALVHRAAESALAGDRREAVADLRDLLAQEPGAGRALGAGGFPALLGLVGQEPELDQTLAECLALAVLPGGQESPVTAPAARQLAAAPAALGFLLHNLRPEAEFYTQYHSLQALRGLAFACPAPVQEVGPWVGKGTVGWLGCMGHVRNSASPRPFPLALTSSLLQPHLPKHTHVHTHTHTHTHNRRCRARPWASAWCWTSWPRTGRC